MATAATGKAIRFLTTTQVQRLHQRWVDRTAIPSQPGLLDSAVNGPIDAKYYGNQENIFQLAENLSEKIMKNHAYQDGNKRTALVAANAFLQINGYELQKVPLEGHDDKNRSIAEAHVALVTNKWTTKQLGDFYRSVATEIEDWTPEILAFRDGATES